MTEGEPEGADADGARDGVDVDVDDGDERVRVWLVERDVDQRDLVTLTYATLDGERVLRRQHAAATMRTRGLDVTAAATVATGELTPVTDDATRERYAAEAARMASDHDPGDAV
jgi:hypothetical protein